MGASSTRAGTATTDAVDEILSGYPDLQAAQEALYKDLHAHPELSHHEHRTAQRVAGELEKCGAAVQTGIGGTGVVGLLANGDGPTVLLRAELDALPDRRGHRGGLREHGDHDRGRRPAGAGRPRLRS